MHTVHMSQSRFESTRWTLLQKACESSGSPTQELALDELCQAYWKPLYWFVRRGGHSDEDAADMVQGFFAVLLERGDMAKADRRKGRLRTFLLALLKGYLSDQRKHANALKRGGGVPHIEIEATSGEDWISQTHIDAPTPEAGFDHAWAKLLLERALGQLREEARSKNREAILDRLCPHLLGESDAPLTAAAKDLNMSEGNTRVALHRLRTRFRERLREEVAQTLPEGQAVEPELRYLAQVLSRHTAEVESP